MTTTEEVAELFHELEGRVDEVANRATVRVATVLAVDPVNNLITYDLDGQPVEMSAQAGYLPEVGQEANIIMNAGVQPVVATPPAGTLVSTAPSQVEGVIVTPALLALLVEWAEVPDADVRNNRGWYEVQVGDASDFSGTNRTDRTGATSWLATDLLEATDYWVRVRAIDQAGAAGPYSTVVGPTQVSTIPPVEVADGSITTAKLADDAVTAGKIAANAVTASELADLAVTTTKVTDDAITTAKLAAFAVVAGKIAANTITAAQVAADTLTATEIAAGAVTTAELAALSVSTAKLQANAVTANEIAANAVTTAKLDALAVTAAKIAANTITAGKLAAGTVTANEITATFALRATQVVQSTSYVAGTSGWSINADGTAEFNNVTVRGTLVAPYIDAQQANGVVGTAGTFETTAGSSLLGLSSPAVNGTFEDSTTTGWTGGGATLSSQATLPHSGTRSMRIRSNAGGTVTATTPTGTNGMDCSPLKGYQVGVWLRTAATARTALIRLLFYKADGSACATTPYWTSSYVGQTSADSTTYVERVVNQVSPPDAAFMAVQVEVQGTATSEDHHVDDITVAESVPGWGGINTSSALVSRLDITTAQAHSGTKSMLFASPISAGQFQGPRVACTPGQAARLSLWLRNASGTTIPSLVLRFFDANMAELSFVSTEGKRSVNGTWRQYTHTAVAPASAAWVAAVFQDSGGGTYYVDDVDLRLVATVNSAMYFNGDVQVSGALLASSVNLIDERILTGSAASVTLSIPGLLGYRSLRLEMQLRGTTAGLKNCVMQFNGDAGANYSWDGLNTVSGTPAGGGASGATGINAGYFAGSDSAANVPGVIDLEIPNHATTTFIKSMTSKWGTEDATIRYGGAHWGRWNSTSVLGSITLLPSAGSFAAGSRFYLYGE